MFNLVQLLANRSKVAGENGKMEKSAVVLGNSLPNPGPTRLGQLAGVNETKSSHQTGLTKELTNPYQPSVAPKPAEGLSAFTGNDAVKDVSHSPIRSNVAPVAPKPAQFTRIPRTTEPRGVGIGKVARNTGIVDVDGNAYVNTEDVELLGKLGFSIDINEYIGLEKTSEALDLYSYIEKEAGVPKAVSKAVDKGEAFSGSFLEDMEYRVPKGYEIKGDLCCPVEKKASRLRDSVDITSHSDPSGLQEYKAAIGDKQIGNMLVADVEGKGKVVAHSILEPEFRGMGLGKKLYGEVMRRQPEGVLHSGPVVSDDAKRVWDSLKHNKGYNVVGEAPELVGQINSKALNIPNKIKKVLAAPAAAEVKGSLLGKIKSLLGAVKKAEATHKLDKEASEKTGSVEKESFEKTAIGNKSVNRLFESLEKTAAADPSQSILVTGHSGAGKSTLAKALAERLKLPLERVDAHPEFKEYVTKDDHGRWQKSLTPGTEEHTFYTDLVHRANQHTLENSPAAAIIEGAQLGHMTPEELAKYKAHIVVGGDPEQSIAQRIARSAKKKGITFTPAEILEKQQKARAVVDFWAPGIEKFKKLPGMLHYNHTEHELEPLLKKLQGILHKKAEETHELEKTASSASRRIMDMLGTADQGKINETLDRVTNLGKNNEQPRAVQVPSNDGAQYTSYTPAPIQQNSSFSDLLGSKQRELANRYGGYNTDNNSSVNSRLANRYREMHQTSNRSPEEGPRSTKVEDLRDGDSFSRQKIDASLKGKNVSGVLDPRGHSQGVLAQFKIDNPNFTEEPYFTPHGTDTNLDVRKDKNALPPLKDRVGQEHLDPTKRNTFETVLNSQNVRSDAKRLNATQYFLPSTENKPGSIHTSQLPNALQGYMYKGNPIDTIQAAKNLGEVSKMPVERGFFFSGEPAVSARYLDSTALTTGKVGTPMNQQQPDYVAPAGFRELRRYANNARTSKNSIADYMQDKLKYSPAAQPQPQAPQPQAPQPQSPTPQAPQPQAPTPDQGMPANYMRTSRSRAIPPPGAPVQSLAGNLSKGLGAAQTVAAGVGVAKNIYDGNYGQAAAGTGMMAGGKLLAKNPVTAKALPALGAYTSGVDTVNKVKDNDLTGAAISGANTVANGMMMYPPTAPLGAVASAGLTGIGMARDAYRNQMVPNPNYAKQSNGAMSDSQKLYAPGTPAAVPRKDVGSKPQTAAPLAKQGEATHELEKEASKASRRVMEILRKASPTKKQELIKRLHKNNITQSSDLDKMILAKPMAKFKDFTLSESIVDKMLRGTGHERDSVADKFNLGTTRKDITSILNADSTGKTHLFGQYPIKQEGLGELLFTPHLAEGDELKRKEKLIKYLADPKSVRLHGRNQGWQKQLNYETVIGKHNIVDPSKKLKANYFIPVKKPSPSTVTANLLPTSEHGYMYKGGPSDSLQDARNLRKAVDTSGYFFSGNPEISAGYAGEAKFLQPAGFRDLRSHLSVAPELRKKHRLMASNLENYIKPDPAVISNPSLSTKLKMYGKNLLDSFKKAEATHELKSSNIKAVGYDKKEKELEVHFHSGGEYKYSDVPASLFHRLLKVKSPGGFFHKHIKKDNPFEYERLNKAAGIPEHVRKAMINGEREVLQRSQKASVASRLNNIAAKKHKDELSRLINMGEEKVVYPPSAYNNQTSLKLSLPEIDYEKTQKYILPRKTS